MAAARSPIRLAFAAATALCLAGAAGAQQLYRWVDEHGRVTYSDRPPPAEAVEVEERAMPTAEPAPTVVVGALSLEEAVARSPVTVFAVDDCEACDSVRGYFRNRGVPFSDFDVGVDRVAQVQLEALVGRPEVPTVRIGGQVLVGYNRSALDMAMSQAGYPDPAAPTPAVVGEEAELPEIPEDLLDDLLDDLPGS